MSEKKQLPAGKGGELERSVDELLPVFLPEWHA